MALQPITNKQGEVIDEYDDGQPNAPAPESHAAHQQEQPPGGPPVGSVQASAETAPDPTTLISQREPPTSSTQQPASAGKAEKEDPTDFEQSDVKIEILLHRASGDPQGRLVSVLIHNFSGPPATQDFREADLTDKARLDSVHRAIYPVMQRFLLDLAARKQKKLEEEAKRAPRPAPKAVSSPSSSQAAPPPTKPVPPASTRQQPLPEAEKEGDRKQETGKQGKYQSIPLF